MNLLLEDACIHWNDVDLEFSFTDFERFWSCFWFESFSKRFCLRIRWFTTVDTRCKPWNRYGFQRFLGFLGFLNQNSSNSLRIYIDSDSLLFLFGDLTCVLFWFGFGFSPVFYSEIWPRIFRVLRSWFCLLILGLKFGNKPVICLSSSSPVRNPWNSFPLLLELRLCDRIEFVASGDEFDAWIAEDKAQWWWFNPEPLRANANSIDLAWIFASGNLGFVNLFFNFSEFVVIWSNWMEREICELFVTWHWFCGPLSDW